jgi:hypothetical protein
MPFSFVNPWLWLGVLAIAAPLWLHLRRKKETSIVYFSALRFLEDQPEPRKSPLRLRDFILLSIRILALLLIVCALAWPYIRQADTTLVKESRVYILDNTLSYQAGDGFIRSRSRISDALARNKADTQVAVVELSAAPRVLVAFGDDPQSARRKLEELQPSFQRGSYLAAFRQAGALLANSLGEHKRIVFFGDNQQNQWNENVNTPPFLRDVQLDLPKTASSMLPNLSLSEPRVQRIFLGEKSLINFTAKLSHAGEAQNANVILQANGQVIFNKAIDLREQSSTILLQAQWEAEPSTWLRGEIAIQGTPDALLGDNRAFFSLAPVQEGNVVLLAQSQYLRIALSPEIMRGQWATRPLDPTTLAAELASSNDADVLCIESNFLQSGDARKLVWRYLTNGRGVVLLVNRVTPSIKSHLQELGFDAEDMVQADQNSVAKFQFVSFNHAIFHPFLSSDYGNLMDIKVSKYAPLKANQALPLLFSEHGTPLFFQGTKFPGKFFVTAFGLDREQTTWPVHQTFIPFLDLMLQAARADDQTPTSFEPGEVAMIPLPTNPGTREAVLANEGQEFGRGAVENGKIQLRMPEKPGLYTLTLDNATKVEKIFNVNPSPKESELVYAESAETANMWRINNNISTGSKTSVFAPRPKVSLRAILQQRVWWWMMLGGLLALILEMVVAEGRKRQT